MEKHDDFGLQTNQETHGVWERKTGNRRLGQNQLFGSFRINPGVRLVNQSDPTDDTLAVIASILQKPSEARIEDSVGPTAETTVVVESAVTVETAVTVESPVVSVPEGAPAGAAPIESSELPQSTAAGADVYVKCGPGPLEAIRFKWTTRPAGDGTYFVDETIGNNPRVMTAGPMSKEQAIQFVDQREHDARKRFDALKNEMIGQPAATNRSRAETGGR